MIKFRQSIFLLATMLIFLSLLASSCKKSKLETGSVTDIDGNTYKTVKIGEQWWMAENLKTTHYSDGTPIEYISASSAWVQAGADTAAVKQAAYCWYNNDSATNAPIYGALYNWYAVNHAHLAPAGWHIPTDAEWTTLTSLMGNTGLAAGPLKEAGTAHWNGPYTDARNESGFTALPGGYRDEVQAKFNELGLSGCWWTSTEAGATGVWSRKIVYDDDAIYRIKDGGRGMGLSIRCVKD